MTVRPREPYDDSPTAASPGRRVPLRFWLLGFFVALLVLITATGGIRGWWAHRLHDITGGSTAADYVIGLVVGLLPVLAVLLGAVLSREHGRFMRAWRMLMFGATGFVITYLLSPSLARLLTDSSARAVFDTHAPGYLAGVLTGTIVWILALVLAVLRLRARWRKARTYGAGREPPPTIIDV